MQTYWKGVSSIFLVIALLMGCTNTVQGVGKDMQDNGKAIQKSAQ